MQKFDFFPLLSFLRKSTLCHIYVPHIEQWASWRFQWFTEKSHKHIEMEKWIFPWLNLHLERFAMLFSATYKWSRRPSEKLSGKRGLEKKQVEMQRREKEKVGAGGQTREKEKAKKCTLIERDARANRNRSKNTWNSHINAKIAVMDGKNCIQLTWKYDINQISFATITLRI